MGFSEATAPKTSARRNMASIRSPFGIAAISVSPLGGCWLLMFRGNVTLLLPCTRRAQVGASVLASSCRPRNQSVTSSLSLHGHDPTGGSHGISDSENSLSRLVAAAWPLVARAQQPALSLRDERPR